MALQADALSFPVNCINYGPSLFALTKPPSWGANSALFKGATLVVLGHWVLNANI